ncbi:PQQ-binding-like beta-propeller repeat protein [Streptomyces sp. NBC_00250]|uniref:outer membrane protein assembly factor BamB family protein n=1 Tax=Streptomyces sp. NBC_00250 TaxID=2903641 RepID=UPI002E2D1348|nr:PQQ-binding-like beta-propeller repeat protein [Streptomyces sp. NBC_00250]
MGGVLLAVVGGFALVFMAGSGYVPFFSMRTAWEAPYDRGASDRGNSSWLVGDTVARSRFDGVTGFDVGSGHKRWEYVVPGRADTCAVSPAATGSVVLLAYGLNDERCATVVALDLTDGRELWHTTAPGTAAYDTLVTGGGLGVLRDSTGRVRAVDLRTGASRWNAAVPKGCATGSVAAAEKQVLATVACGTEAKLAAFDPADGKERWTVPLDARRGVAANAEVRLLSAEPAVVSVADQADSGMRATLAFGPDGRPQGRIDDIGDYGSIEESAVGGGRLFAIASYEGSQSTWERVVAFDLATGDQVWRADLGNADLEQLDVTGGRVTTVSLDKKYGDGLYVFDAATGDEEEDRAFRERMGPSDALGELFTHGDRVVVVRWGAGQRPLSVYERW